MTRQLVCILGLVRVRLLFVASMLLLVAGVAAAVVVPDDEGGPVVVSSGPGLTTTSVDELPTTIVEPTVPTTVTVPTVTVPTVTVPRILRPPKPPPTTVAPAVVAKPQGGTRCGTPSGYDGRGADRTATSGRVTVTLQVYTCEFYEGESMQNWVIVSDKSSRLTSAHVDYGDGKAVDSGIYPWPCDDPKKPDPYYVNLSPHGYAAPGAYEVVATVGTASCADGSEATATVRMTVYRIAGKRPAP